MAENEVVSHAVSLGHLYFLTGPEIGGRGPVQEQCPDIGEQREEPLQQRASV